MGAAKGGLAGMSLGLAFVLGCGDGPSGPARGDLVLVFATTGVDPDPDGYLLRLDDRTPVRVTANQTITLADLTAGDHEIEVTDVAPNCALAGDNPRAAAVVGGQQTEVDLQITCNAPPGSLHVSVTTTGFDLDADGYAVLLDGNQLGTLLPQGAVILPAIQPGPHTVALAGVAPNCAIRIPRQQPVTIASNQQSAAVFGVLCSLASGPTAEQILYESASQVFIVNSDGSGASPLTAEPGRSFVPAWSPDRSRIAVSSDRVSGEFNLWTMAADGSDPIQLTNDDAGDRSPSWSPDQTQLVFSSLTGEPAGQPGIYVVTSQGGGRAQITAGPSDDSPSWSPDGTRIVFTRDNGLGTPIQLYLMQPDGSGVTLLPTPGITDCVYPRWSPDGTRIAFSGFDAAGSAVWVMNDDGSGLTRLTPESMTAGSPSWSPTGDRLVFKGQATTGDGLYTIAADGTGLQLRVPDIQAVTPAWAR